MDSKPNNNRRRNNTGKAGSTIPTVEQPKVATEEVKVCRDCVPVSEHESLKEELAKAKQQVIELQGKLSTKNTDLSVLRSSLDDRGKRISHLEGQLNKLSGFSKWWYGINY